MAWLIQEPDAFPLIEKRPQIPGSGAARVPGEDPGIANHAAHQQAPVPSLCDARPDAPQALDEVFQRMLAKRPEDRYQSPGAMLKELEAWEAGLAEAAAPGKRSATTPVRSLASRRYSTLVTLRTLLPPMVAMPQTTVVVSPPTPFPSRV